MSGILQNIFLQFKPLNNRYILGARVDGTSYEDTTNRIIAQVASNNNFYICVANVHVVMEAYDSEYFRKVINEAAIVTPDGMPLAFLLSILVLRNQKRVYGPTLMKYIIEASAQAGICIGFYGGTPKTLKALVQNLTDQILNINIGYACSPPFRPLIIEEDEALIKEINSSGTQILFVGLGCPKQERWMFEHRDRVKAVMIGVGAAFDFFAGTKKQAPKWMMRVGLEWLFRLYTEPKRLWRRYLYNNPRFLCLAAMQLLNLKNFKADLEK
jgi:N-acetylglucosaminyldiphosphoundecaprenol N-acetyl-beta-D-mannosaminyltransferase